MKLLAGLTIAILLVISVALLLEYDRVNYEFQQTLKANDKLKLEMERLELETQSALREAQCYHEECVRLAFEYMSDTVYTLPCNGRQVEIGGR